MPPGSTYLTRSMTSCASSSLTRATAHPPHPAPVSRAPMAPASLFWVLGLGFRVLGFQGFWGLGLGFRVMPPHPRTIEPSPDGTSPPVSLRVGPLLNCGHVASIAQLGVLNTRRGVCRLTPRNECAPTCNIYLRHVTSSSSSGQLQS